MRGILIVNPRATTMSRNTPELVTRSLAGLVDLDVRRTERRGHARELAAATDADLVLVLGGDGAVNEAVNGIMTRPQETAGLVGPAGPKGSAGPKRSAGPARPVEAAGPRGPLIGVVPGGGGNVFARALGLPLSTEAAVGRIRDVIAAGSYRTIGLGLAGDRYFTFSADLGFDAEVMHEMDELREAGRRQSTALYLRTIVRQYYRGTDRRVPALTLERDGQPPVDGLFMTVVTNRSPWTYLGGRALLPMPNPDFSSGLDLLALRRLRAGTIVSAVGQLLWVRSRPPRGRHLLSVPGLPALVIRSSRPIAFQVDGEYLGETKTVEFRFVPDAIRVVALRAGPWPEGTRRAVARGHVPGRGTGHVPGRGTGARAGRGTGARAGRGAEARAAPWCREAPRAKCDRSDIKLSRRLAVGSCACQLTLKGLS